MTLQLAVHPTTPRKHRNKEENQGEGLAGQGSGGKDSHPRTQPSLLGRGHPFHMAQRDGGWEGQGAAQAAQCGGRG